MSKKRNNDISDEAALGVSLFALSTVFATALYGLSSHLLAEYEAEKDIVSLDRDTSLISNCCGELNSDTPVIEVDGQQYTVDYEP